VTKPVQDPLFLSCIVAYNTPAVAVQSYAAQDVFEGDDAGIEGIALSILV